MAKSDTAKAGKKSTPVDLCNHDTSSADKPEQLECGGHAHSPEADSRGATLKDREDSLRKLESELSKREIGLIER